MPCTASHQMVALDQSHRLHSGVVSRIVRLTKAGLLILIVGMHSGCVGQLLSKSITSSPQLLTSLSDNEAEPATLGPKESAMACLKTAQQLDSQHHWREAIALYERARSFDPATKDVSRRLAVLYAQANDNANAKVEFERAISEKPKDAALRSDAGFFAMQTEDFENAEVQLMAARDLSKDHPQGTLHLAMLRARQERLDESLELFQQIVGPAAAHSNLGVLLAKAGKRELAIEHLEEAQRLDPSLPVPSAFLKHLQKD